MPVENPLVTAEEALSSAYEQAHTVKGKPGIHKLPDSVKAVDELTDISPAELRVLDLHTVLLSQKAEKSGDPSEAEDLRTLARAVRGKIKSVASEVLSKAIPDVKATPQQAAPAERPVATSQKQPAPAEEAMEDQQIATTEELDQISRQLDDARAIDTCLTQQQLKRTSKAHRETKGDNSSTIFMDFSSYLGPLRVATPLMILSCLNSVPQLRMRAMLRV